MSKKNTDRVTVQTYTNAKGNDRVAIQISRGRAIRITTGDYDALNDIREAIKTRIEREESSEDGS